MLISEKKKLRKLYSSVRNGLSDSERYDFNSRIFAKLINSCEYINASKILIYVSVGSEVNTREIIDYSLEIGKTVAVPLCVEKRMDFCVIDSSSELISGVFGIPTIKEENKCILNDFENALCIVPALSFDVFGNRLGYGGGYYDRFLSDKNIYSIGMCFERCMSNVLPFEEYDIKIDCILTENSLRNSKKEVSTYG